ncbi:MAG: glycosyltransferase family 1 protein [Acidobacteriota bacterium]
MNGQPLRIGVDGRAFVSPAGGVRRYVHELYGAIARVHPEVQVIALGAPAGSGLPAGVRRRGALPFPTNLGWMAASMPLAARGAGLDVYHAPAYTAPLWGVHPQVLTIHDVSYERRPEWNAYRNDPLRRFFYRTSAHVADRIVTDSGFSRDEITAAYGIPATRIDVVPLAAGAGFAPGAFDAGAVPAGVTRPYALHVGDLHVRRNVATALAGVLAARRSLAAPKLSLVCAGVDRGTGEALVRQAGDAGDPGAVALLGPVSEPLLLNLYRGAMLLVYPSRYEGFGLPVLEAMQCGVPVAAARAASLPEVVGDAGILLGEQDEDAWTRTLLDIVSTPEVRATLSAQSLARAAAFSWERTARETVQSFRRAVNDHAAQRSRR